MSPATTEPTEERLQEQCLLEASVVPAPERAAQMRRMIGQLLRQCGVPVARAEDAVLAASELITNAVRYGTGRHMSVRLVVGRDHLTMKVHRDTDAQDRPRLRIAGTSDEQGRGLFLVDALATAWGVSEDGTTTWCTLSLCEGVVL